MGAPEPSRRVCGGNQTLATAMAAALGLGRVRLGTAVLGIMHHDEARVAATSVAGSRVGEKCCAAIFSQKAAFRPPVADKVDVRLNASI